MPARARPIGFSGPDRDAPTWHDPRACPPRDGVRPHTRNRSKISRLQAGHDRVRRATPGATAELGSVSAQDCDHPSRRRTRGGALPELLRSSSARRSWIANVRAIASTYGARMERPPSGPSRRSTRNAETRGPGQAFYCRGVSSGGTVACPGCGGRLPNVDGPVHAYVPSSPACWQTFAAVQADDIQRFGYQSAHGLLVDAYMAQHLVTAATGAIASRSFLRGYLVSRASGADLGSLLRALAEADARSTAGRHLGFSERWRCRTPASRPGRVRR